MARTSSPRRRRSGTKRTTPPAAPPREPVAEAPEPEALPAVVEHEPAVGDVASTLGVSFKRLSYRALIGAHAAVLPAEREMPDSRGRSRRGRRGRGGRPRQRPPQLAPAPVAPVERLPIREAPADESAHSAPHDEIVGVVRELVERTSDHSVLIDTLANALKSRSE